MASELQGVYFIECERFIKIGQTRDVVRRVARLETGNPFPIRPLGFIYEPDVLQLAVVEGRWHRRFAMLWERGEWFRAAPILRDAITFEAARWPTLALPRALWTPSARRMR
jgi:hypothetical protein